jgi:hypothetical protein
MYRIYYFLFLCFSIPSVAQSNQSLLLFEAQNELFGYKNESGQIILEAQYQEAYSFTGNYAFVKKNNTWGLINMKGKEVIPASYEDIGWMLPKDKSPIISGEILGYKQSGKWGLISTRNKLLSATSYDIMLPFSKDKIKVGQISVSPVTDTLYGVIDIQGKVLIPLQYHILETTPIDDVLLAGLNKLYTYSSTGKILSTIKAYGLLNWANTVILPIEYKAIHTENQELQITPFNSLKIIGSTDSVSTYALDTLYAVSAQQYAFNIQNKTGLLESTGILHANMDGIQPEQNGLVIYKTATKYGALIQEKTGLQSFLPAIYDSVHIDSPVFIRAGIKKETSWQWEILKRQGTTKTSITQQPYSEIETITQKPLIKVKNDEKYGYINQQGEEVIPLQYDFLGEVTDSICIAVFKGKYGILHQNGKWIFEPKADYFAMNRFGHYIRKIAGKYEVLDHTGRVKYITTEPLQFVADGSIAIQQKGKHGRISPMGIPCVPAVHDSILPMTLDHTFWAYTGKNIFLYSSKGEVLVKPGNGIQKIMYQQEQEFLPATINGRYGFIDSFGRLRLANRYEDVRPFEGNMAAVRLAGKWGFITKQDKLVIQPYYDEVGLIQDGKVIAKKDNKYGIIDVTGKILTPFSFDKITRHLTGVYLFEHKGKQGMLNKRGFEVLYAKYDQILPQQDGKAIIRLNNKYGLVDAKGILILPPLFDVLLKNPFDASYLGLEKATSFTFQPLNTKVKAATK